MEWPTLLASTARLLDLHDCDRSVGASVFAPPEGRPGTGTGLWLAVGTQLVQYLHERDLESNEAWVPLQEIIEALTQEHGIERDDVLFVANYLATPTRLITLKDGRPGQHQTHKRETALLEWPRNTNRRDRCRLSASGARSVRLAQAAQSWLYAADDAGKLERAIEFGAYADIPQLADGLIGQIRRFSKEITLLLERRHVEDLLAEFTEHRDAYLEVIKGVQGSVESASEHHRTKQGVERYAKWLEAQGDGAYTEYMPIEAFTDILRAVERLNRKFQSLVAALASTEREVIGLVRFDQAAIGLAFRPCSQQMVDLCIAALGPWSAEITAPVAADFTGMLNMVEQEHSRERLVFDEVGVEELPAPIERFLAAYREPMLAALHEGPVSLGQAVQKGWMEADEFDLLAQLVGVYASPSWLDRENNNLAVSMIPGALNVRLPDGGRLEGDDLVLHWLSADPVAGEG